MRHSVTRLATTILALGICFAILPVGALLAQSDQRCFPETGFCVSGRIRQYWEQNGGLPVFGYPIGPQQQELVEGTALQVQWFERNRLELHPENQPPYDVLLGRLGVDRLEQQKRDWNTFPKVNGTSGNPCYFAAQTGHAVCGVFFQYFRDHGLNIDNSSGYSLAESVALFGLPISEPQQEVNVADGKTYLTQWFERARFELHPEVGQNTVLLGLLGNEVRGNNTTPTGPTPTPAPQGPTATPVATGPTGRIAFSSDRNDDHSELYTMKADGTDAKRLTDTAGNVFSPSWSPDGTQIAFVTDRDGNPEIYTMNSDGTKIRRLTNNGINDLDPQWSPDGSKIVFVSERDGNREIYVMNTNGANVARLTNNGASDSQPAWSPDGKQIIFSSDRNLPVEKQAESDLYVMNADGSNVKRLLDHAGGDWGAAWSPDGKRIAFYTAGFGQAGGDVAGGDLFIVNTDGSGLVQLSPDSVGGRDPSWSPNGRFLAFSSARNDDALFDIYTIAVDGSNLKKLTTNPGNDYDPAWAPK